VRLLSILGGVVLGVGVTLAYGATASTHHARAASIPAWLYGHECRFPAARTVRLYQRPGVCEHRLEANGPHGPRVITLN
jgi:hypothetical protein